MQPVILDSQGKPVRVLSSSVRNVYENRGMPLSGPSQGQTMMSRFAGNKKEELSKYKKLASDIEAANPSIRSPLLNQSNFYMPESDSSTGEPNRLMNQWITYYCKWAYDVSNLLSLHSTVGGTNILTDSGAKEIKDITAKDKVLSSGGEWQKVYWGESHKFIGNMVSIRGSGCLEEDYTHNHPVKIVSGRKVKKYTTNGTYNLVLDKVGEQMWVPAERVNVGDYLVIPKFTEYKEQAYVDLEKYIPFYINTQKQPVYELVEEEGIEYICALTGRSKIKIRRFMPITEEFAELLGWYVAEGSSSQGTKVVISLNKDKDPCDHIIELFYKLFGVVAKKEYCKRSEPACMIVVCCSILSRFFPDVCGRGAHNKKIPEFIYLNKPEILKAFVKAYILGDGCNADAQNYACEKYNGGHITCSTVSKTLAFQLRTFCTKLGFLFGIRYYVPKKVHPKAFSRKLCPIWLLVCARQSICAQLYGEKIVTRKGTRVKEDENNFYAPVTKKSIRPYSGLVYDIKTSDHSFITSFTVHNSELPLSRFSLRGITDKTILNYYEDMAESMELHSKSIELLKQFFTYGECFPFAYWSEKYNCFTDLTFLSNNYVYVKGHYLLHSDEGEDTEFYELEPDPMLVNLVKSNDYVTTLLREHLNEDFVAAVQQNKRLLLSNFSTSMIKNKIQWSDLRGTSIILRCIKSLMLREKYKEANYSIADAYINPKLIWRLGQSGDLAQGGYMPSEEDLTAFRDLLVEANNDPVFTIITHYAVNLDIQGVNGKLLPISQELERLDKEVMMAMFANEAVTTGQGPTYASASVAFRALMSRYIPIRAKLERYYYHKIFAPVAYANKFYERKKADLDHNVRTGNDTNKLIIPQIDWRSKSNLLDDGTVKSIIASAVTSGRLPMRLLTEVLDLDYNEVRDYLWAEQGTVFDPISNKARDKFNQSNTDETMIGQPFAPKTNSPVSTKTLPKSAAPVAKKAASLAAGKVGKATQSKYLTIKPLKPFNMDMSIQTQINKGKPEKGGNPEATDPMEKALEVKTFSAATVSRDVDIDVVSKNYKNRKIGEKLVAKPVEKKDDKDKK